MSTFKYHYNNNIKYDFLTKYDITHSYNTPQLKKVVLNFGSKEINNLTSLLKIVNVLELISLNTVILACSKTSNILLKFREGTAVGCKITLRNDSMYIFFFKLILVILPKLRQLEGIKSLLTKFYCKAFFL